MTFCEKMGGSQELRWLITWLLYVLHKSVVFWKQVPFELMKIMLRHGWCHAFQACTITDEHAYGLEMLQRSQCDEVRIHDNGIVHYDGTL